MVNVAQFPSQGDLLKFVYNATGIIPSKNQFIIDTDVDGRSLHKRLARVAKEEGDFLKNFEDNTNELRSAINSLFVNDMYSDTLLDPLVEMFNTYNYTILTDHTYLAKKESLQYLIKNVFLYRATLSIFKYQQYYSAFFDASISPSDKFWYLEYENTTPLASVINWIYIYEGKSQEEFHSTINKEGDENFDQIEKDLVNVRNWTSAMVKLPPFSNILDVFDRAFRFHGIDEDKRQKYIFFLLIARFATYCLKKMYDNYKKEEITGLLNKLKKHSKSINLHFQQRLSVINNDKAYQKISTEMQEDIEEGWLIVDLVDCFFDQNIEAGELIAKQPMWTESRFLEVHSSNNNQASEKSIYEIQKEELQWSRSNDGAHSFIIEFFQSITVEPDFKSYMKNIENCNHGYEVMKNKYDYQKWLNEFYEVGNDIVFPWLQHWIIGINLFKQKNFENSLSEMKKAFETIRYSAGNRQISFIEDYMLVALAQEDRKGWKDFKVAFKWGVFMNHFDTFPDFYSQKTDDELKVIFEKNKKYFLSFPIDNMDTRTLSRLLFHWKSDTN